MAISKTLNVNGERITTAVDDPDMPLLYLLRGNLGLHGPRFGCGLASVRRVHRARRWSRPFAPACSPMSSVDDGNKVVTLEGLGTPEKPHPVQLAFIQEQASQCGYCINGMIMEAAALLRTNQSQAEATSDRARLANNLCRCGTHVRIVRAVKRAAGTI